MTSRFLAWSRYFTAAASLAALSVACSADQPTSRRANSSGGNGGSAGTAGTSSSGGGGGGTAGSGAGGVPTAGSAGTSTSGSAGTPGGSGGTPAAGSGGGGTGGTGGGSVNAVVVDDFEGTSAGGPPNPALFSIRGSGTVQISTEQARPGGGAQVVKVVSGGSGPTMFVNTSAFPLPGGVVHFRVWMHFANADWAIHVGFVASGPGMESQEVRFGGQDNAYHANLAVGDGLSPNPYQEPCPLCVTPVANQWACLRGMFDFSGNRARLYVGDTLAVDADDASDWHTGTGTFPQAPVEIAFGWAIYGGVQNTVYYDDLAIGYEEIPCN